MATGNLAPQADQKNAVPDLLAIAQQTIEKDRTLHEHNKRLNGIGIENAEFLASLVEKMPKDLGDPATLTRELLVRHYEEKNRALAAQKALLEHAEAAEKKGFLRSAYDKIKNGLSAVGGHVGRNWGKYLILTLGILGYAAYATGYGTGVVSQIQDWIRKGTDGKLATFFGGTEPALTPVSPIDIPPTIAPAGPAPLNIPYSIEPPPDIIPV